MKRILVAAVFLFGSLPAWAEIPVIEITEEGEVIETTTSARDFSENIREALSVVDAAALRTMSDTNSAKAWTLRSIVVGIGIGFEAGIGPIAKVKATPRFRVVYSNSRDPIVP